MSKVHNILESGLDQTMEHTKQVLAEWEKKFACSLCDNLPEHPQLLRCTHSFCKDCIIELDTCPKCGFNVTPKDIVPNLMLSKLLSFMRVSSTFANRNQTSFPEIEEHKEKAIESSNKPIKASNILVKQTIFKNEPAVKVHDAHGKRQKLTKDSNKKNLKSEIATSDKTSKPEPNTPVRKKKGGKGQNKREEGDAVQKTPRFSPKSFMLYSAKKAQCPNKVNTKGETRLQIACRQGKLSLVQQLLEEGAEPNVKDYAHWTPLCDAVNHGHIEVVRTLVRAGACVNTPTQFNTTALVEAVVRRDKVMVRLLMQHGADMNQRTALNNTALSLADDEMRAIMLEVKNVPIQPHIQVALTPKTILISRQLSQEHVDTIMELCKRFNLTLTSVFTADTTHVVVPGEVGGGVAGSFEALLGLASGCCVVVFGWVTACHEAERLMPVDGFEPSGTPKHPDTDAFKRARVNREKLLPRLFDGSHVSLQHNQRWPLQLQEETEALAVASGARFQSREMDAERIPCDEHTVMFHVAKDSALALVSHIILYRLSAESEPVLKYNMLHIKSLPVSWFLDCIHTFTIDFDPNKFFQS